MNLYGRWVMRIREIRNEANERFTFLRFPTMSVYGAVYLLFVVAMLPAVILCVYSWWWLCYAVPVFLAFLALLPAVGYGMKGYYLKLFRFEKPDANYVVDGFRPANYKRVALLYVVRFWLWLGLTILLIVPGIIYAVRSSMATYLLRADPKMKVWDALKLSNKLMKKHSGKYFLLFLSYMGWFLGGIITAGIGLIWAVPYFKNAKTAFYKRELQGDTTQYPVQSAVPAQPAQAGQHPAQPTARVASPQAQPAQAQSTQTQSTQTAQQAAQPAKPVQPVQAQSAQTSEWEEATAIAVETEEEDMEKEEIAPIDLPSQEDSVDTDFILHTEETPQEDAVSVERMRQENTRGAQDEPRRVASERPPVREMRQTREDNAVPPRRNAVDRAPQPQADTQAGMRRTERAPLPGGRVVLDENGRRTMERKIPSERITPERTASERAAADRTPHAASASQTSAGAQPRKSSDPLPGESVQERLERLRAERAKSARNNEKDNGGR